SLPGTRRSFMRKLSRLWLAALIAGWAVLPALGQQPSTPLPPPSAGAAKSATVEETSALIGANQKIDPAKAKMVAASVNGQPLLEGAVLRGLKRVPLSRHAEARPEILNYLIENALIGQYLLQMRVAVDAKEIDAKIEQMKAEIKKEAESLKDAKEKLSY